VRDQLSSEESKKKADSSRAARHGEQAAGSSERQRFEFFRRWLEVGVEGSEDEEFE
jgi:hypothetical protein